MATAITREEEVLLKEMGARLHEYREKAGISQRELAEVSGVDRAFLNGLEAGKRRATLYVLARLAHSMGTTVSVLTRGIEATLS